MIFKMSWQRYLSIIFLAFGVGQLGLALISWVAANWQHWSIFQKLYSVQGTRRPVNVSYPIWHLSLTQ